jgi:hypothetical protein
MRGLVLVVVMLVTGLDFPPYQPAPRAQVCPGAVSFYKVGTRARPTPETW